MLAVFALSVTYNAFLRLIDERSRSSNYQQACQEDKLIELCDRLEHIERTGDGDLDILMYSARMFQ